MYLCSVAVDLCKYVLARDACIFWQLIYVPVCGGNVSMYVVAGDVWTVWTRMLC